MSKEFRTQLYTKVVQDIKNSTVDDYDPERVLNLDDDRTTNFAVFGENTILLDSSVSITISGDTYTIENASDALKAMQPGDSFAQTQENGEVLIVKTARVKVSGDTVTITDDPDADLSDVFEVVKIEGKSDPDKVTWDDSTLDDSLEVISDTDPQSYDESQETRKIEFGDKKGFSRDYVFAKDKDTGVTGKITASFSVGANVYIVRDYKYISYKLDTAIAINISVTEKLIDESIPLEKFVCPLVPACNIVIIPKVIFKVSGKIIFKGTVKCTLSEVYDSDSGNGWQDTSSAPKFEHETAISATFFFGLGLEGGFEILDDDIFYVSIEGQVGAEIKVKSKLQELSSASTSSIHPCEICFSGTVGGNLELSSGLKLLGKDIIGGDTGLQGAKFTFEWSLFNFYYCADDEDWGFGTCPHISYKVKLNILDRYDQPMKDITFQLHQGSYNITEVLMMDEEHNGTESTLPLSVQVSAKAPTIRLSRSSVKLNARTGDSVTLKLTASPSDFDLTQVELSEATGTLTVTQVDEMGCFSLSTAPQSEAPKSCSLTATAPGGNTARLSISMISAAPTMTAKASGKIDLSYPQTGLAITPVLKNYSGTLTSPVYSLSVKSGKDWEDVDIADQLTLHSNGKLYQAPTFSLPSGTLCRITLQGQLPDGTSMRASVLVKVTQTPIPLKLSKSSLTLNKALGEWGSITVSSSVRGYPLGTPEIRLTDSKGFPSQALDFHYQDGQLKVSVNDATAYGQTYQLRLWVTPTKVAILRVKILAEQQSSVVLSARARGSIDVIRDESELVITPSYRNYAGQMPLTKQVWVTMAQGKENEAQDVSHQFLWAWSSDGKLHLQKAPGALLDLTARYRLELSVEGGAKAAVLNLNLRSGSAKVRLTQPAVLYAKDVNSQSLLTFQILDKSLNALEHVQIRGAKQNEWFAIVPWAGSQFSIIQVPGSSPKSSRITLELFFEGNTTQKPNAIVTASVTIR